MKTFSDFSLNLFCLLFGFFLGNLFPNISLGLDFQKGDRGPEPGLSGVGPPGTFDPPGSFLDFFRLDILIQTISDIIPGPSHVGLVILLTSELINWTGKFFRIKQFNKKVTGPSVDSQRLLDELPIRPSFFSFINSVKIGLLFGIFVDAFKVGS